MTSSLRLVFNWLGTTLLSIATLVLPSFPTQATVVRDEPLWPAISLTAQLLGREPFTLQTNATLNEEVLSNQHSIYRSDKGYTIEIPDNGDWKFNSAVAREFESDLIIQYKQPIDNFTPNVNIIVIENSGFSITDVIRINERNFRNIGFENVRSEIDEGENSGYITYENYFSGLRLQKIQRYLVGKDYAYLATASLPARFDIRQHVNLEVGLAQILESFRIE